MNHDNILTCTRCGSADVEHSSIDFDFDSGGPMQHEKVRCRGCDREGVVRRSYATMDHNDEVVKGEFAHLSVDGLETIRANLEA